MADSAVPLHATTRRRVTLADLLRAVRAMELHDPTSVPVYLEVDPIDGNYELGDIRIALHADGTASVTLERRYEEPS